MKKFVFVAAVAGMLASASCGGNGETTSTSDSTSVADTATPVADTTTLVVTEDTVPAPVAEPANPEEVLTLTVESKNLYYPPECSAKSGSWTVKVTNNGTSAVSGDEYVVAYSELLEEQNSDGDLVDVTKKRTAAGKDVAPGESVTIKLNAKDGCQDFKNPKIQATKK